MKRVERNELKVMFQNAAHNKYGKTLRELGPYELDDVIATVVNGDIIKTSLDNALGLYSKQKIAVYFSMEFLVGKVVVDALNNAGILEMTQEIFEEEGVDIHILEEVDDAALGNGGLGRLAACFIESLSTQKYPGYGSGLFYKYGLFKQTFNGNGQQVEVPDDWSHGNHWFKPHEEDAVIVTFEDTKVRAVPYIMPVIGYKSNTFPLTLWKAEPIDGVTNESAAAISDWLYPKDENNEGKKLRIRQEYFFTSAQMQYIFNIHYKKHGNYDDIEKYYVFQMNDTHPVFAVLEFIKLLKERGYTFDQAFEKAKKCFAYTNHTVMAEALEKWPILLFKDILPDVFKVVEEINQKLLDELMYKDGFCTSTWNGNGFNKEPNWSLINEYEMFSTRNGIIYMSNIACYMAYSINGVAAIHTDIIKKDTLKQWYKLYPEKFNNKTNGVTPRRFVVNANPELSAFLTKMLESDAWITDMTKLSALEPYKDDPEVLAEFAVVRKIAKMRLVNYVLKHEGVLIDPSSFIDCQVKRIHEYKRQLMNALRILYIYDKLKKGELKDFYPTTFIVGGKAASGYALAKLIIQLFKDIQDMVNNDSEVNTKMKVIFLTNFNVSYGEKVYAGTDLSEQVSKAGKEASGTSNMKFMMNGAVTIGTLDGANVEIENEVKPKNIYIFGATVEEFKRNEPIYRHDAILAANPELTALFEYLKGHRGLKHQYWDLVNTLEYNDTYFVMYDLQSYIDSFLKANADYDKEQKTGDLSFTAKSFRNTIRSGIFSSDRTIREYVRDIWHIEQVDFD